MEKKRGKKESDPDISVFENATINQVWMKTHFITKEILKQF